MDYATVADLEARWRPLDDSEKERAETLLGAASRQVRALCKGLDARIEAGDLDGELVTDVVCSIVKRAMLAPIDQNPISQVQQTAGPFSQSGTFVNPAGDLYLTKVERKLLGCGGQRAFSVDLMPLPEVPRR